MDFSRFQLAAADVFAEFTDKKPDVASLDCSKYNYCPDCVIPMGVSGSEYQCGECGRVTEGAGDQIIDHDETTSNGIRITTGANKGRFYNNTGDYCKTQKKFILDQLNLNQHKYNGLPFPQNILNSVAVQYNTIQKYITEDDISADGHVRGQKKFVRRGNIKDEVLAGLIYFECIREKLIRKKRDIAGYMRLPTFGFSRGEDILRNLQAEGKIDIPVDEEPLEGFIDRYIESLGISQKYSDFIIAIVEKSEQLKIGMNSQLSSKIVGALWIVITMCGLRITSKELEKSTDNTKKNTFVKFYKVVFLNIHLFRDIFVKEKIPIKY